MIVPPLSISPLQKSATPDAESSRIFALTEEALEFREVAHRLKILVLSRILSQFWGDVESLLEICQNLRAVHLKNRHITSPVIQTVSLIRSHR